MAPLAFPLRRWKSREQYLLCGGGYIPLFPSFFPFLLPSHSLSSDVDWIGLERGGVETEASLMKMTMHPPCLDSGMHVFSETLKCLVQVCENNWKGKRLKSCKDRMLKNVFVTRELISDKRCIMYRICLDLKQLSILRLVVSSWWKRDIYNVLFKRSMTPWAQHGVTWRMSLSVFPRHIYLFNSVLTLHLY